MSETSKKIMGTIHEQKICPRPKWYFLLKNTAVWFLLILALFLGAFSVGMQETVMEKSANPGFSAYVLFGSISFLWLLITVLFAVLAYANLRLTKDGYRYRAAWILFAVILVIIGFGVLFHHEGVNEKSESMFNIPLLNSLDKN
jgi:amino acid transporter